MAVPADDWLRLINHEYLRRYIAGRGCAIKFIRAADAVAAEVEAELAMRSRERLLPVIRIDAATTRLHMLQDVFFAIARVADWNDLAQRWIEAVARQNNFEWPRRGQAVPLSELAEAWQLNPVILRQEVLQWISRHLMNQRELTQDFRAAMAHLCMRRLEEHDEQAVPPVIEWLRGELRTVGAVRSVPINAKITRHNARAMLRSLCHWLRIVGGRGFVVTLDLRQVSRTDFGAGLKYTAAAAMDVFEVLRQLIDESESFEGFFLLVLTDDAFVHDGGKRSLDAYLALKQRIFPDVQARAHENPLAPLLQLSSGEGADLRRLPTGKSIEDAPYTAARVAIEALRSGVPNRSAIKELGTAETMLTERFGEALRKLRSAASPREVRPREVIAGGFGSGKSHLLGYLADNALREDFVVSTVAISKETPLFDTERVYAAAIRNAQVANANDDIMALALQRLRPESPLFKNLEAWTVDAASGLSPIFAAILELWPKQTLAPEERLAIVRFLSGAKLGVARVRQWLRNAGGTSLAKLFDLKSVKAAELARQRLAFAPALFRAAGFSGWCVLLDEVELIGRYTRLQRARSYAELARWLGLSDDVSIAGLVSVCCITDDFTEAMQRVRGGPDEEQVPLRLREKGEDQAAGLAVSAMNALAKPYLIRPPTDETVRRSLDRLRELYRQSYGGSPPPAKPEINIADTMRHYIKSSITLWDIDRLYGAAPSIEVQPIASSYDETPALEQATPGDDVEDEVA